MHGGAALRPGQGPGGYNAGMGDPFVTVEHQLPGWQLSWAEVTWDGVDRAGAMAELRRRVAAEAREWWGRVAAAEFPVTAAVRRLFRRAGCDPTRYRPSSEALLRRLLKGEELPPIHPLVDLNNCLSVAVGMPACVMAAGSVAPPFVLRAGAPGERMESLRGPFDLAGKPLLADGKGPFGTPITDSERVRVGEGTREVLLVVYVPAEVAGQDAVADTFEKLVGRAPGIAPGRRTVTR